MHGQIVSDEFERRKGYICALPFNGVTVSARGEITLCCATPNAPLGNLKDVSDLNAFYNGAEMEYFRTEMQEGRIGALSGCVDCFKKYSQGHWSVMTCANEQQWPALAKTFDPDWHSRKQGKGAPLRFLEYTCSNICNQTCSTCSSFFSSKWRDLDKEFSDEVKKEFGRPVHENQSLTDEDIEKIIKVLPHLNLLVIKGGEPWADKNNINILSRALDVNPQCTFQIISNMQAISDSTLRMLEKVKTNAAADFNVSASIDATGRAYDWIRSSSFEKTVKNMEKFYEVTGRQVDIGPFISFHNYFEIEKIVEYFHDKEYVAGIGFGNISVFPDYIKVQTYPKVIHDMRREMLRATLPKYQEKMQQAGKYLVYEPLLHDIHPSNPFSMADLKRNVQWVEHMNKIRGFRLQDHVSELQGITEMAMAS